MVRALGKEDGMEDVKKDHGIPVDEMQGVLDTLGIQEHTEEDCQLSNLLGAVYSRGRELPDDYDGELPLIVEGAAVFVLEQHDAVLEWTRYRISASDRRRIIIGIQQADVNGDPDKPVGTVTLAAW
jgi:hypothetical protein